MSRTILLNVAKYGLGFALLAFVAGPGLMEALQRPIQVTPLVIGVAFAALGVLLTFVRWYVLVIAQDLPFTFHDSARLGLLGYFASSFLPGSVSGDVVKIVFLAKEQSRRTVAVSTVLIDRAVGLWGAFWLVTLVGGVFWLLGDPTLHHPVVERILGVTAAITGASLLGVLSLELLPEVRAKRFAGRLEGIPKIGHSAAEVWRAVWMYHCRRAMVGLALLLAISNHACSVMCFYCAAQVFQTADPVVLPSLAQHFVIVPVGLTIQAFSPTPGGVGGGEAAYAALYLALGATMKAGGNAAVCKRLIEYGLAFTGYLLALRMAAGTSAPAIKPAAEPEVAAGVTVA